MDNEQNWNYPQRDPRLHLENGSLMLPMENTPVNGVNDMPRFNVPLRSSHLPLPNNSYGATNYRAANYRPSHNPYMHSSAGSTSQAPPHYVNHGQPYNNHFSPINLQVDYRRAPFKRKISDLMTLNSQNSSVYYSAGSSSNSHVSSDQLHPNPMAGSQFSGGDLISMDPSIGSNNPFFAREGSSRNVRSRHSHTPRSELNPYVGNNLPPNFSTANTSSAPVAGQWSHNPAMLDPSRRVVSSGVCLSHEMTQSLGGSSLTNSMEISGRYRPNYISARDLGVPFSTNAASTTGPPPRCIGYNQRNGYRACPIYQPAEFASTSNNGWRPSVDPFSSLRYYRPPMSLGHRSDGAIFPLRQPRPLTIMGRSSGRIGRGYFNGSRDLFDQHRNMRLDIESMRYEISSTIQELLDLEERIGNVSMGLSEEEIVKCLTKVIYCSHQIADEEGKCVICLDEYKDADCLARLRCGHDFHFSCIKKWLLINNACPICKGSADEGSPTGN